MGYTCWSLIYYNFGQCRYDEWIDCSMYEIKCIEICWQCTIWQIENYENNNNNNTYSNSYSKNQESFKQLFCLITIIYFIKNIDHEILKQEKKALFLCYNTALLYFSLSSLPPFTSIVWPIFIYMPFCASPRYDTSFFLSPPPRPPCLFLRESFYICILGCSLSIVNVFSLNVYDLFLSHSPLFYV